MAFALPSMAPLDVRELYDRDGAQALVLRLLVLHPVEVTEALEQLDGSDRLSVFRSLPVSLGAQVLLNGDAAFRSGLLERLPPELMGQILDRMPVEHATQLLDLLDADRQAEILAGSSLEDGDQMAAIRRCSPTSVGRLMVRQVARIRPDMTVTQAIRYLREHSEELETVNDLFVLDEDRKLCGVLALRELLVSDPRVQVRELMKTRVVMVTPETDREEAANLISRYNFLSLPVVDSERRLLGVLTVDDLIDVMIQEGTEDVLHLGAISGGGDAAEDASYWAGRITSAVRKRVGWLLLLFVAGSCTSQVLSHFQTELRELVALSFFVPLLIGTGGNAGSQTVITVVRGLALGEIRPRDAGKVVFREAVTGLLLGLLLGVIAFFGAFAVTGNPRMGAVLGASVVSVCTWSTSVGALVPMVAHRLRIDPSVASAPFISTLVDATGLMIYFLIAKVMLGL